MLFHGAELILALVKIVGEMVMSETSLKKKIPQFCSQSLYAKFGTWGLCVTQSSKSAKSLQN